jgi:hypothetical protein
MIKGPDHAGGQESGCANSMRDRNQYLLPALARLSLVSAAPDVGVDVARRSASVVWMFEVFGLLANVASGRVHED